MDLKVSANQREAGDNSANQSRDQQVNNRKESKSLSASQSAEDGLDKGAHTHLINSYVSRQDNSNAQLCSNSSPPASMSLTHSTQSPRKTWLMKSTGRLSQDFSQEGGLRHILNQSRQQMLDTSYSLQGCLERFSPEVDCNLKKAVSHTSSSNFTAHTVSNMLSESNRSDSPAISEEDMYNNSPPSLHGNHKSCDDYKDDALDSPTNFSKQEVVEDDDSANDEPDTDTDNGPVDLKKNQVEDIVSHISMPKPLESQQEAKRNKRKQTQPQQHGYHSNNESEAANMKYPRLEDGNHHVLHDQLSLMQNQINQMQKTISVNVGDRPKNGLVCEATSDIGTKLASSLKTELKNAVNSIVDDIVDRILVQKNKQIKPKVEVKEPVISTPSYIPQPVLTPHRPSPSNCRDYTSFPHKMNSFQSDLITSPSSERSVRDVFRQHSRTKVSDRQSPLVNRSPLTNLTKSFLDLPRHLGMHSPYSLYYPPTQVPIQSSIPFPSAQEQTEALSLVVNNTPKKKRTKVTDTRLSPRAARAILQEGVPMHRDDADVYHAPSSLPTSVAIPNPSLNPMAMYSHNMDSNQVSPPMGDNGSLEVPNSPSSSPNLSLRPESYDGSFQQTSTLTPMHLRKAKLMFFYCRYPSSAILKIYFPDVKFNKNNTAQLVKWFSNFREFYYIQMEKYARQSLAEGVTSLDQISVSVESELYRVLNLHYNRNNQIEVPDSFRLVVQTSLQEFFRAIQTTKDVEQSWKKPIYKVIARLDSQLPDFFKSPIWMEQLAD